MNEIIGFRQNNIFLRTFKIVTSHNFVKLPQNDSLQGFFFESLLWLNIIILNHLGHFMELGMKKFILRVIK